MMQGKVVLECVRREGVKTETPRKAAASDAELIARVRGGETEAYRGLVDKYEKRAFLIASAILRSKEDAEDIVQESFVKAYLGLADFRGSASFYTWFYRIVYNMAIDFKRKVARRGGAAVEFDENAATHSGSAAPLGPQDSYSRKELQSRFAHVLNELSEEHRVVITLREIEGLDYREIAKVTGVSKGTVMSRLHYARKRLQQALRDLEPDGVKARENLKEDGSIPSVENVSGGAR